MLPLAGSSPSLRVVKAGMWRQELTHSHGGALPAGLVSYTTEDLLLRGGWALLHQTTRQPTRHSIFHSANVFNGHEHPTRLSGSHGYAIDKQVQHRLA